MDSLSDVAESLSSGNQAGVDIAEEHMSLTKENLEVMKETVEYNKSRDEESKEYTRSRHAKTDKHREEQAKIAAQRWVEQKQMAQERQDKSDTQVKLARILH